MMNFRSLLIAAIGACVGVVALETYYHYRSGGSREEIQQIVRDYIVAHPEVLQESMAEFEKRQQAADAEKGRDAIKKNSDALFNSSRQVVAGNPQGDVTLVEFFDYNCPYCKQAHGDMNSLIKSDDKLRVIYKDFPVLGPGSVEAAQVAVAIRMQDPSGEKSLAFREALLGNRGQADKARALAFARDIGADMSRLETDLASDEIKATLEENFKLAEQLGLNGTPSYVIGSDILIGAVGLPALKEKVKVARCGAATSC
ncbi:MAG: DsbA family protein [Xanthobacteraceae bacterium]